MLRSLSVRNFALIEQVTIDFENGLHVITGETGSGKSILLGALNLILGDRADYSVIRDPEQKTVVEAVFSLQQDNKCWFDKNDVDFEHETIIRREIATQGKSRAFINDTPVQLTQLKDFVERLIYIHSQHETLEIRKPSFQFELIDAFSGNSKLAEQVALNHSLLLKLNTEKQRIEQAGINAEKEKDYLQFQLNELELLNLDSIQYAELESYFEKISQVEELKTCYNAISNLLEGDQSPVDSLRTLKTLVDKWKQTDENLSELSKRIQSTILELQDVSKDAEKFMQQLEVNPEEIHRLSLQLDEYNRVLNKHQLHTQDELIFLQQSLRQSLESIQLSDERLESLKLEIDQLEKRSFQDAEILYQSRLEVIPALEKQLLKIMHELKMEQAQLHIKLEKHAKLDINGGMTIDILFSANKGLDLKPIDKIASGGELSRLMLAIQLILSDKKSLPTLIFDEIDTGVSGEVALRIGSLLKEMGKHLQIIAITHLPQVAAFGGLHLEVSKSHSGSQTTTQIKRLNYNQRIEALAKLISGEQFTESAKISAKELLENS